LLTQLLHCTHSQYVSYHLLGRIFSYLELLLFSVLIFVKLLSLESEKSHYLHSQTSITAVESVVCLTDWHRSDLRMCLRWQGAKSNIWKCFLFPSGDVSYESEACGMLELSSKVI
jgi:hypothetical protein